LPQPREKRKGRQWPGKTYRERASSRTLVGTGPRRTLPFLSSKMAEGECISRAAIYISGRPTDWLGFCFFFFIYRESRGGDHGQEEKSERKSGAEIPAVLRAPGKNSPRLPDQRLGARSIQEAGICSAGAVQLGAQRLRSPPKNSPSLVYPQNWAETRPILRRGGTLCGRPLESGALRTAAEIERRQARQGTGLQSPDGDSGPGTARMPFQS